jgi:hypothetical protein
MASTCFEHYLLILRRRFTNDICSNGSWLCQLTLYARNIPTAVREAPPDDEQVMLEACGGP